MSTRKERRQLANELAQVAIAHGANVVIEEEPRSVYALCEFPGKVKVSFDIDDLHKGGILSNWFEAQRDLVCGGWFDSVNEYHKRKASMYSPREDWFRTKWEHACKAVADGRAFQDVP